jgi:hypothetical protein
MLLCLKQLEIVMSYCVTHTEHIMSSISQQSKTAMHTNQKDNESRESLKTMGPSISIHAAIGPSISIHAAIGWHTSTKPLAQH